MPLSNHQARGGFIPPRRAVSLAILALGAAAGAAVGAAEAGVPGGLAATGPAAAVLLGTGYMVGRAASRPTIVINPPVITAPVRAEVLAIRPARLVLARKLPLTSGTGAKTVLAGDGAEVTK